MQSKFDSKAIAKLNDKSTPVSEQLDLARIQWNVATTTTSTCSSSSVGKNAQDNENKQQYLLNWLIDLIAASKRNNSRMDDEQLMVVWQTFATFLAESESRVKQQLSAGSAQHQQQLFQVLIDTLANSKQARLRPFVKQCCCLLLAETRCAHRLVRNYDQMTRLVNVYAADLLLVSDAASTPHTHVRLISSDERRRLAVVLRKYFMCLKLQSNLSRIFNRFCTQTLFTLLRLSEIDTVDELVWPIINYVLFNKSHVNIYTEFVKNLPASNAANSNYQVVTLFNTLQQQQQSGGSLSTHHSSLCRSFVRIVDQVFAMIKEMEYKHKCVMLEFLVDLLLSGGDRTTTEENKMDVDGEEAASPRAELVRQKLDALTGLFQFVDKSNMFNEMDDKSNDSMFKKFAQRLVLTTLAYDQFNESYVKFLVSLIGIDHTMLDAHMAHILVKLQDDDASKHALLSSYLRAHVKYRQFGAASSKLIKCLRGTLGASIKLPSSFFKFYASCLSDHNVDVSTSLDVWRELNDQLASGETGVVNVDLVNMLACVLGQASVNSQKMSSAAKQDSHDLLASTRSLLFTSALLCRNDDDDETSRRLLPSLLHCCYVCGLVHLANYRFSLVTAKSANGGAFLVSPRARQELSAFLHELNERFALASRSASLLKTFQTSESKSLDFNTLFFMSQLHLVNVVASSMFDGADRADPAHASAFSFSIHHLLNANFIRCSSSSSPVDRQLAALDEFACQTSRIVDRAHYSVLHIRRLVLDQAYLILPALTHATASASDNEEDNNERRLVTRFFDFWCFLMRDDDDSMAADGFDQLNVDVMFNDAGLLEHAFAAIDSALSHAVAAHQARSLFFKIMTFVPVEYLSVDYAWRVYEWLEKLKTRAASNEADQASDNIGHMFALTTRIVSTDLLAQCDQFASVDRIATFIHDTFDMLATAAVAGSSPIDEDAVGAFNKRYLTHFSKLFVKASNAWMKRLSAADHTGQKIPALFDSMYDKVRQIVLASNTQTNVKKAIVSSVQASLVQFVDKLNVRKLYTGDGDKLLANLVTFLDSLRVGDGDGDDDEDLREQRNYLVCVSMMSRGGVDAASVEATLTNTCWKQHKSAMKRQRRSNHHQQPCSSSSSSSTATASAHVAFLAKFVGRYALTHQASNDADEASGERKMSAKRAYKDLLKLYTRGDEGRDDDEAMLRAIVEASGKFADIEPVCNALESNWLECVASGVVVVERDEREPRILRLIRVIGDLCAHLEMRDEQSKKQFAVFIQRFLVQMHPVIVNELQQQQLQSMRKPSSLLLVSLLDLYYTICSSKHILVPSHLVVSDLQAYFMFSLDEMSGDAYVQLQDTACQLIGLLIARYSKKFTKIASLVVQLLTRFVRMTSQLAAAATSSGEQHEQSSGESRALRAAKSLDRLVMQLVAFKREYGKIAPYVIAEYVHRASAANMFTSAKSVMTNAIYHLISMCDIHGIAQLHVLLAPNAREHFRKIYADYEKYFKYVGKT